ncbi:hypothetical protein Tco_0669725 [Tanacetum coccineum]
MDMAYPKSGYGVSKPAQENSRIFYSELRPPLPICVCVPFRHILEVISNSWAQNCDPVTSLTRNASQKKSREDLLQSLLDWDIKAEAGLIDDIDISKREDWIVDLNHLDQLHRMTLNKRVQINGLWYDSPSLIKQAAFDYFSSRFKEVSKLRPTFSSSLFRRLSHEKSNYLELSISMDEIKTAVSDYNGSKAPGPDGVSLVNGGSNLSLLQYADDALFFDDWSKLNVRNVILSLKCFEHASSLKVNLSKSRLFGIGIPPNVVEEVVVSLGCTHDVFPFLYLGLPDLQWAKAVVRRVSISSSRKGMGSWLQRCLMVVMSHFGMILGMEMGFVSKIYSQDYSLSKFARIVKSLIDGSLLMVFGRAFGTGDAASSPVPIQMSFRTFIWQILILEFIINGIHEYLESMLRTWIIVSLDAHMYPPFREKFGVGGIFLIRYQSLPSRF